MIKSINPIFLLMTLAILFTIGVDCYAGSIFIFQQKILGCYQQKLLAPPIDSIAMRKMDSIKTADTMEKPWSYPGRQSPDSQSNFPMYPVKFREMPIVFGKWGFVEDSCLSMYFTVNLDDPEDAPSDVFEIALFNWCDSSIYHFGGDLNAFSRVVKGYLKNNFEPIKLIELLRLFVNTYSCESIVYLLRAPSEIDSLITYYIHERIRDINAPFAQRRKKDFEDGRDRAKALINSPIIRTYSDFMTFEFYTWNYISGRLEKWRFRAKRESLELLERSTVAEKIGPFDVMGTD